LPFRKVSISIIFTKARPICTSKPLILTKKFKRLARLGPHLINTDSLILARLLPAKTAINPFPENQVILPLLSALLQVAIARLTVHTNLVKDLPPEKKEEKREEIPNC
jgi:hypothetical protein